MLELANIIKFYELGKKKDKNYQKIDALKGVSIKFRESEFVSILGPSGCGKTTLLNIIGGLDKYTSGDLIINGKSTKEFCDKDWDNYRNHSVGFVFQSYNLIPHQSVLENVELALTLSGVSREERKRKAVDVLKKVGLGDKINAKPNQLSGGQMQRVAIARALVNDPDVILADEPTGALDTKTSEQIMELLKSISEDKLIVMVTHNPDIAERYSTRIIRLKDGEVVDDSNPIVEENNEKLPVKRSSKKKTSMSFVSALSLSFKNLLTKKARTIMVAFAGSIGIIGIALILALSTGFQKYIDRVQEDSLSNYPLKISQTSTSMMGMMGELFMPSGEDVENEDGYVYSADSMTNIFNSFTKSMQPNDLASFKQYINDHYDELEDYVNDIQYSYAFNFDTVRLDGTNVDPGSTALYDMVINYAIKFIENKANVIVELTPIEELSRINLAMHIDLKNVSVVEYGEWYTIKATDNTDIDYISGLDAKMGYALTNIGYLDLHIQEVEKIIESIVTGGLTGVNFRLSNYRSAKTTYGIFNEMINNETLLSSQYDLLGDSKWPTSSNEVVLVLDENNQLDDYVLYALGFLTEEQVNNAIESSFTETRQKNKLEYSSIIGTKYKVLVEPDYYIDNGSGEFNYIKNANGEIINRSAYESIVANDSIGATFEIVGICRLKDDVKSGCLATGINYTKLFTEQMIGYYNNSEPVRAGHINEISLTPISIQIYSKSFDSKQNVIDFIEKYNTQVVESKQISYTDMVGLLMNSISTIISAISYILIAFVSVSLIVSSIMIGIITYISVLERIKEIGVLRAVGASKKDIKRVFTAEALIIGFVAGVFGIGFTLLLTIPINIIIKNITTISSVASLPLVSAIVLVLISMFLTFVAGLIPANIASKKDPVIALRTE